MGILDTFYLKFTTDARGAASEVAQLEKQIESLREKGKKRSEQENKDLKEAIARRKELKDNIEKTNRETEKLIDNTVQLAAAYVSFGAIKNGIVQTAEFNRALSVQSKNLGQATNDMRAYMGLAKQMGGSPESMQGFLASKALEANSMGLSFSSPKAIEYIRNFIKGMTPDAQRGVLSKQLGVPLDLFGVFMSSDEEYAAKLAKSKELTEVTEKADAVANKFVEQMGNLDMAFTSFWTKIGENWLPIVTEANKAITDFVSSASKDGDKANEVLAGAVVTISALAALAPQILTVVKALTPLGRVVAVSAAVGTGAVEGGDWIGRQINKMRHPDLVDANGRLPGDKYFTPPSAPINGDAVKFFMSKGYSMSAASTIAATIQHESGWNPAAVGDGGQAKGLIQWHPDRRSAIMTGTGIDVTRADRDQQLEALAWEMDNSRRAGWDPEKFRKMTDISEASAYYTKSFITPRDIAGESMRRAQTAMGIAGSYTPGGDSVSIGGDRSASVKIDKVDIHTQATDAQGIAAHFAGHMDQMIRSAVAQVDDGEAL